MPVRRYIVLAFRSMGSLLVVEDDQDLRDVLAEALEAEGWTVHAAASAEHALSIAESTAIDVVLCDLLLPTADGLTLRAQFQSIPALRAIRFVFMTAGPSRVGHLDGAPLLSKPFRPEEASRVLAAAAASRLRAPFRQAELDRACVTTQRKTGEAA